MRVTQLEDQQVEVPQEWSSSVSTPPKATKCNSTTKTNSNNRWFETRINQNCIIIRMTQTTVWELVHKDLPAIFLQSTTIRILTFKEMMRTTLSMVDTLLISNPKECWISVRTATKTILMLSVLDQAVDSHRVLNLKWEVVISLLKVHLQHPKEVEPIKFIKTAKAIQTLVLTRCHIKITSCRQVTRMEAPASNNNTTVSWWIRFQANWVEFNLINLKIAILQMDHHLEQLL